MLTRPRHLGLHHVALHVADMAAVRAFYVDLLGYQVEWEQDADNLYLTCGCDNLALHSGEAAQGPQRLDHLGIVVAEASDVSLWEAYLQAHQVPILAATRHHRDGATSCYVRDPAGNAVQIIHHPPISPALATLRSG